jgi:hypothetical protein
VLSWFEALKKKRYPKSFVQKLNDTEAEVAEKQSFV